MGTRSLTVIRDEQKNEICVMYRQYDGYLEGHGKELAKFLNGFVIVNGYNETVGKIANGSSCLAAQIISNFKGGVGQFYLYPAGTRDYGEEYIYYVDSAPDELITITACSCYEDEPKELFKGTPKQLLDEVEVLENV